jgi:hypothetical protein
MPPRPFRHPLRPPAAAALALVTLAACADPVVAPRVVDAPSAALPAPVRPALDFGPAPVAGLTESFNYAGAIASSTTVDLVSWDGTPVINVSSGTPATGTVPTWALLPPAQWKPTNFDVAFHTKDRAYWLRPEPFRGMHGTGCQPFQEVETLGSGANAIRPGDAGSHAVATYDDMNYRCRNHMMTAIKATQYGVIYVTPGALVDLNGGEAVIKFALSTFRSSGNDWVDVWVTPWAENLALPLDGALTSVDLQGPPKRAIHVRMTAGNRGHSAFQAFYVTGHAEYPIGPGPGGTTNGYESVLNAANGQSPPVSTRRDTFELRLTATHVKFGMRKVAGNNANKVWGGAASITWIDADLPAGLPPMTWGPSVVQFGHHSMLGAAADAEPATQGGGTWHWDDYTLAPAVPFTILRATNVEAASLPSGRYADGKHPDMQLASPMPAAGSRFLRFAAFGDNVRVRFGKEKWVDAEPQPAQQSLDGRFRSYFVAIPADVGSTTALTFKAKKDKAAGDASDDDDWVIRDVAVWVR